MAAIPDKDRKCREIDRPIALGGGMCESCRVMCVPEKTFYPLTQGAGGKA